MVGPTMRKLSGQSTTRWYFSWKPSTTKFSRQASAGTDGYHQTQKLMVTPRSSRMCLTYEPRSKKVHGGLASRVREFLQARGCIKDQNAQQRLMAIGSGPRRLCWTPSSSAPLQSSVAQEIRSTNRTASDWRQQSRCPQCQVSSVAST